MAPPAQNRAAQRPEPAAAAPRNPAAPAQPRAPRPSPLPPPVPDIPEVSQPSFNSLPTQIAIPVQSGPPIPPEPRPDARAEPKETRAAMPATAPPSTASRPASPGVAAPGGGVAAGRGKRTRLILTKVPPKFGLIKSALFVLLTAVLSGVTAAVLGLFGVYYHFSEGLPEIPQVAHYRPPVVTEVYTDDATLAGDFYRERRKVVPYERIPKRLIQAFIASEDNSFFDHGGVDYLGTARAAFRTILKKATGAGSVQGGSTLTQQTAKAVLISAEGYKESTARNLRRKIREAILARRLEAALTKEEILYLYLNNVFLGHHSYGVQAAAENYYRKDVRDLTLAEMSLIAGLPQAPSRYSPFLNPDAAKKRRAYVLGRMLTVGMISKDEHDQAVDDPIKVYPVEDVFHEFAPYFVEEVRKDVVNRYGNEQLLTQGLKVFTTMDAERQRAAQAAELNGLLAVDKRQGWRGPVMHLSTEAERKSFRLKSVKAMAGEKLTLGKLYVAQVTSIDGDGHVAEIQIGNTRGKLPIMGMRWAHKASSESYYPSMMISSMKKILEVGDVIVVRHVEQKDLTDDSVQRDAKLSQLVPQDSPLFRLEQDPELQGALVSIDPQRQYLTAMVGGYDFDANEFNRAFQACRQPGSSFKPFVYSAAMELLGWTEATVIVDSPIVLDTVADQTRWKPSNYEEKFVGDVLLRSAIINSMNIPAVKTFQAVGVSKMTAWAKKLGLTTPINQDLSSALGSSCVHPYELAQVYATFNRLGSKRPTYFIRKVEDRFGRTLEDHTAYDDAWAPWKDRLASSYSRLFEPGVQVMSPQTGYLITDLMRGVVLHGTGGPAQALHKPAAGKTGTTNDSFDAWFAGFTRDLVAVAWVGYDLNQHPLGHYETGGRAALPIWLDYMKQALEGRSQPEFWPPEYLGLVRMRIDSKTGKRASSGSHGSVDMWFKKGTVPEEKELEKNTVDPRNFQDFGN